MPAAKPEQTSAQPANMPPAIVKAAGTDKVLWYDRPGAAVYAKAWLRSFFVGTMLLVFAVVVASVGSRGGTSGQIYLVVGVLSVIGGYYALAPLYGYLIARYFLIYILTDTRLVIVQLFPSYSEIKVTYGSIEKLTREDTGLNQGTLYITKGGKPEKKKPLRPPLGLYGIKRLSQVEDVLKGLIKSVSL